MIVGVMEQLSIQLDILYMYFQVWLTFELCLAKK